jgi:hypothetical protein
LAGAAVFVGQILLQGQKGQKKVSANLDFTTKMWEVFNVLQSPNYCNSSTNLVFKEKTTAGSLTPAKLSAENTPTTNTVSWIGYQVGSGASAQDIKVLERGDVIENTLTVSEITFERQKDTASNVITAQANKPSVGRTTQNVNLIITANPTSGSGFPVTKTFKLNLITDTPATNPTNEVVGCMGFNPGERSVSRVNLPSPNAYILGITETRNSVNSAPLPAYPCTSGNCGVGAPEQRWRISQQNPDEICQDQGYAYASGTCYIDNTYIGGPANGALVSNRTIYYPALLWAISCLYGWSAFEPPTSITCVK